MIRNTSVVSLFQVEECHGDHLEPGEEQVGGLFLVIFLLFVVLQYFCISDAFYIFQDFGSCLYSSSGGNHPELTSCKQVVIDGDDGVR